MVSLQRPSAPPSIKPAHWNEWLDSCVDPNIVRANVRSMQGEEIYEWLMEDLWGQFGNHASQYVTGQVKKYLDRYSSLADGGGWCCRGLDPLSDWERMRWGQIKPDIPRLDPSHPDKVIKYEPLPGQPSRAFFLHNPADENFWRNVQGNPVKGIILTEGAKKAGALISMGYAAIAVPGVNAGYRVKDDAGNPIKPELIADLAAFAQPGRKWVLAFDQDSKNLTRRKVEKALAKTGLLLVNNGCTVSIASWNGAEGKGIDDLIASRGRQDVAEILAESEEFDIETARIMLAGDDASRLEAMVIQYAVESNPYRKALIEAQIGSDFKIRGNKLSELAFHANPKPAIEFTSTQEVGLHVLDEIEARSMSNDPIGVPTGFRDLDFMTQGLQKGDLILLAGRPSMGKSAFAGQVCHQIAKVSKLPVAIFSLEMSSKQLLYRQIALESGIGLQNLRAGRIASQQWNHLSSAIGRAIAPPVFISGESSPSVHQMWEGLKQLKEAQGGLSLVMIDYLQLMDGSGDNRVQALSSITRNLKLMSMDLDVPVLALSQLSRAVESRTNKRPINSDLRDSGSLEQDADSIFMLYRDEYYDPDTPDVGIAEVIVTKNRNGPTGTTKLLFEKETTRFLNLSI